MSSELAGRVQPGDILADKYRVDQVLGAGGMGVVVAAEHLDLCERVAIKFLLDDAAADGELSERFLREARAAVKIKSEHVVRIIDTGRLASGAPYMVMEYLEGADLAQTLEAHGRASIEDAVDYVIQACEAMNVAHHAGIIHRDLKPANLFLTKRPDGSPIIKVLDFGISKVKSGEAAQLSLTRTQTMMGSPLYMSPEQMRSSKDVDRRTDVWSLGVILHELISGDVPFSGAGFPEVLVKVMTESAPALRSLRPEVPAALEALVLRCLSKSPADRFSSVAALAVALSPFASARTLSLQSRLRQSLSEPPAADPEPVAPGGLLQTRIEAGAPAPVLPFAGRAEAAINAAGTLASRGSNGGAPAVSTAELPLGTHTSWEDASPAARKPASGRWPMRVALLAGAATFAAGLFAVFGSEPRAPESATPAAAAVSPAPTAPTPAPVLAPADPPTLPAAAPAEPTAVAPAPAPAVPASAPAASSPAAAVAKPQAAPRRPATRAAASRSRASTPPARPDPPTAAPAPAPKPARSKPLSLEFK